MFHLMIHNKLLLAQKTGSGKSVMFQLVGVLLRGVVLLVGPLLAQVADQFRKARELSLPFGNVFCYNLDQIKSHDQIVQFTADICPVDSKTNGTYFLFSSPQTIATFSTVLNF